MGTLWNRSGVVERYADDLRAVGAKAYFFQGGTTTPLTVFQDGGEIISHPHPVVADANGRWPAVFIPFVPTYDVQVTSADDENLSYMILIPNPNPLRIVDPGDVPKPENLVRTGMIHAEFVGAPKIGYVRLNGLTIGDADSQATEMHHADAKALFIHLWSNVPEPMCKVLPARGENPDIDWANHKQLTLPDMRGSLFAGLDDMGNTAAGRFGGLTFIEGGPTTPGSYIGGNIQSLEIHHIPAHTHTGTTNTVPALTAVEHDHTLVGGSTSGQLQPHHHEQTGSFASGGASVQMNHHHDVPALQIQTGNFGGLTGGAQPLITSIVYGSPSPANTTADTNLTHTHTTPISGSTGDDSNVHRHSYAPALGSDADVSTATQNLSHVHTFTTNVTPTPPNAGLPFVNLPSTRLVTWYIKL
jgi:hypothetical protein